MLNRWDIFASIAKAAASAFGREEYATLGEPPSRRCER